MNNPGHLKLVLPYDLTEQDLFEISHKGWLSAEVETIDGRRFPVNFFDLVRLEQTIIDTLQQNVPCFTEPGIVVVPKVTLESINRCLVYLSEADFCG